MSNGKKQQKKRKRHSSPFKSQIAIRLEKLRRAPKDLWGDDDDDDDKESKNNNFKAFVILSDSDEERSLSSKQRSQNVTLRKKNSSNHVKHPTCLICSILSQLSSYNCCSEHLSILKNQVHQQQATTTTTNAQWLPEQVMILPLTNEIIERYLDPEQIHRLRTQIASSSSSSPTNKKTLTRKSTNKSTMISDLSEPQQSTPSAQTDLPPLASTIVIEPTRSKSPTMPPDITTVTTESSSKEIINNNNNTDSIMIIDINQTTIPTITIDNTQPVNNEKKQIDPWVPIEDEVDAALEHTLDQIDSITDRTLEFSPTTVRRTDTEYMAARLPKLSLKSGRFRRGKPITDRTTSNAANEYRPLAAAQSSPVTSSVTTTNISTPTTTITNIEKEPARSEDLTDNCNVSIFTQDITVHLPTTTTTTTTQNNDIRTDLSRSNETSRVTSSTTNDRATPSRISFRLNPDGTRVSISRPALPTNHQSPLINTLRRTSTDVTPLQPNTRQM